MKTIKFLHCADCHLDAPFRSLEGGAGKSALRRQDLKRCFERIIHLVADENADILLISGDLYEHGYVKKSTIHWVNDLFAAISQIKVVMVPGNHDPYVPDSYYRNFAWAPNVTILHPETAAVHFNDLGLTVHGVGFRSFSGEAVVEYDPGQMDPDGIHILLFHGTVDLNLGKNSYNNTTSGYLQSLGMDYVALGHFHNRGDDLGVCGRIYNPGSPEPLGFDETGEHGVYIGTITKDGSDASQVAVRFLPVQEKRYTCLDVNVDGCSNDSRVMGKLEEALTTTGGTDERGLYSITLKGYVDAGYKVELPVIEQHFNGRVFFMKIKDETVSGYRLEEMVNEPGIRGLFARKIHERMEAAGSEEEKTLLMKALTYGLEALDQGKVEIRL